MKLLSNVFAYSGDETYIKLAKVMEYSVQKNSPNTPLEMTHIKAPQLMSAKKAFDSNHHKFSEWVKAMDRTNDDVILIDSDMLILRDLSDAFNDDFDIGITALPGFEKFLKEAPVVRPGKTDGQQDRLPYNGGVVFVRNNDAARGFIHKWGEIDHRMYKEDKALHTRYRLKYAGMNQASLGWMMENYKGVKIKFFDCREWNWCRDKWPWPSHGEPGPRILHIKSRTRKNVMMPSSLSLVEIPMRHSVQVWRKTAHECGVQKYPPNALDVIQTEPIIERSRVHRNINRRRRVHA